jgi:hypothetical protein
MLPIVATLAKLAPVVAPIVQDVAASVVRGLTKQAPRGLPEMADQFSRLSGDFLSRLTGRSELPGSLPAIMPGGCIPPPGWSKNGPSPIVFPPDRYLPILDRWMRRVDQLLEGFGRVLDLLKDLLGQFPGVTPESVSAPQGLYSQMARTELPLAAGPTRPPETPSPSGPASPTTPTPKAPAPSPPVSSEGLGTRTLERLFDDMHGVESQINGLDPNDPKAQFRLMQLQQKMHRITQMINLIAEMRKALHDTAMAIIRNIR